MLIGQIEGKVGTKFQIAFPKRFREILGDRLIVTKGLENNLIVLSEKNWRRLLEGTEGKPFTNKTSREVQRYLLGNADVVELDTKGRFVVPDYLRRHAKIQEEIIFAGIERFVEIWDKLEWEKHQERLSVEIVSIAERLGEQQDE